MTGLKDHGENWTLDSRADAAHELQRVVGLAAVANANFNGASETFYAYLSGAVNIVAFCGLDVERAQQLLRDVADQLPDAVTASRLDNMAAANSKERPS